VYYTEIDKSKCDPQRIGEYYFYQNLLGTTPELDDQYMECEEEQFKLRSSIIGEAVKSGEIEHPKFSSAIFGLSSLKNTAIIAVEL
jgi:hypothetical protein